MSHKKSYKELRESIRKEVCQSHKHLIDSLYSRIDALTARIKFAEKEQYEAKEKLREAENKSEQYEDWIERLCDYCNMTEADRQLSFEALRNDSQKAESKEKFEGFIYGNPLFKYLNVLQ